MQTIKAIATELVKKFPKSPSLTLARRLYSENPELIKSLDSARTAIRTVRGACGKRSRKKADKSLARQSVPHNPLALPEPESFDWQPFKLTGVSKVGVINDIHIPYHHLEALTASLLYLKEQEIDCLLINGDLVDFYQMSRFLKDPRARNTASELEDTKQFFDSVRQLFPKARIIFKLGNHDERFEHYLLHKAPELLDIEAISLENLLECEKNGVEVVGSKRPIYLGNLTVLHGHEYQSGMIAPVNVARGLFLRAKACALQGHSHQTSEHSETDVRQKLITTWSVGCLCQLHPEYARFNKWNQGFALVNLDGNDFEVSNKRILNGRVL
jgi:predicted phosphodiesterase